MTSMSSKRARDQSRGKENPQVSRDVSLSTFSVNARLGGWKAGRGAGGSKCFAAVSNVS